MTYQDFVKRFLRSKAGLVAAIILFAFIVMAIFAPTLAPKNPASQNLRARNQPPSLEHPFGTDQLGRDILSRVIHGARVSVVVAFASVGLALLAALPLGLLSGFVGGRLDIIIMRLVDGLLSFPAILFGLALSAILGPGLFNIIIVVSLVFMPRFIRFIRGQVLPTAKVPFVEAAHALGSRSLRVMFFHILPNIVPALIVQATLSLGYAVIIESSLTFVGAGIQPPAVGWGILVRDGFAAISTAPWIVLFPSLALVLLIYSANLVGDVVRDVLDPSLR